MRTGPARWHRVPTEKTLARAPSGAAAEQTCLGFIHSGLVATGLRRPGVTNFEFYSQVVERTEAETGNDYGKVTQDDYGFISIDGRRVIPAASDDAPTKSTFVKTRWRTTSAYASNRRKWTCIWSAV